MEQQSIITEQYYFLVIELFPVPSIVTDDEGIPINFIDRESATIEAENCQSPIIVDIKKLKNEKEIDDLGATFAW
jgi:hypothetical protein